MKPDKTTAWQPDGPSRTCHGAKFYDKGDFTKLKWPSSADPPPRSAQDWRVLATEDAAAVAQYRDDGSGSLSVVFEGDLEEFLEQTNMYRVYRCTADD